MPATAEPIKGLDVLLLFVWEALIPAPYYPYATHSKMPAPPMPPPIHMVTRP